MTIQRVRNRNGSRDVFTHEEAMSRTSRITLLFGYIVVLAMLVGCAQRPSFLSGGNPPQSHGGPVRDHVSLVDTLRSDGYTVDPVQDVQQPFLRARGTLVRISGGDLSAPADVQSYNYDDRDLGTDGLAAAQADAAQIQPDGQPRTASVAWSGPSHFFHKERVIVIYVGSDAQLPRELSKLLGSQFAGQ